MIETVLAMPPDETVVLVPPIFRFPRIVRFDANVFVAAADVANVTCAKLAPPELIVAPSPLNTTVPLL